MVGLHGLPLDRYLSLLDMLNPMHRLWSERRRAGHLREERRRFIDPTGTDRDALGVGLKKAICNHMRGIGLDADVRQWFGFPVPKTKLARPHIAKALAAPQR